MNATKTNSDLQVSVSYRQIIRIALPIALALLVPQINFIANTIFLSRLGELELAVAGITGVYYLVFALIGSGFNSGLQALIARRAGENRPAEMGKLFVQAIWVTLFFALSGVCITYFFSEYFFKASLENPEVQTIAVDFLKIRIWGLPFLYLFQMFSAFLVGSNNSHLLKYGFVAEAATNIFLDYALIYGHFGFNAYGFNGAAYASIIAEASGLFIMIFIFYIKNYYQRFELFKFIRFDYERASLFLRQSSPLVMQFLLSVGAWMLFYILIEHKGERPLAVSNTMRNIIGLFGIFAWAFASTTNAMVSNIIGQGKQESVLDLIKRITGLSVICTVVMCLIINLFPQTFFRIYDQDTSFVQEAIPVLRIVSVALILMAIATSWLNGVTGTGNTKMNLKIEIVAISCYAIYVFVVLHVLDLSLVWAWASEFLYWTILFILSYKYLQSNKWKNKII